MTPPQEGGGIDTVAIRAEYEKININPGTRGVINELCDVIDAVLALHNAPTWPEIADQCGICAEVRPCPTVRAATCAPSRRPPVSDASSLAAPGVPSPQEELRASVYSIVAAHRNARSYDVLTDALLPLFAARVAAVEAERDAAVAEAARIAQYPASWAAEVIEPMLTRAERAEAAMASAARDALLAAADELDRYVAKPTGTAAIDYLRVLAGVQSCQHLQDTWGKCDVPRCPNAAAQRGAKP